MTLQGRLVTHDTRVEPLFRWPGSEPDRLATYWHIVCRSRALRRRPLSVTLFRQSVVLFRTRDGQVHALEDRCAHRNAPLSRGCVRQDTLVCPYHGWRYHGDGAVAEVPALSPDDGAQRSLRIPSYACMEQDDYVWVALTHTPAQPTPPHFPFLGERGWSSFRLQTRFAAPVEACLENFLDCPHAAHVHKRWFRTPMATPVQAVVRARSDGAEAEYFDEPRKKSLVWWLLSPKRTSMRHTDRFIAPSMSRVDYVFSGGAHYVISSHCTPLDDGQTLVHTVISFRFGPFTRLIRLFFEPLARIIIRQDVDILRRQQENIRRFGAPVFTHTPADLLYRSIHAWRQALKSGKPTPPAGEESHVQLRL